MKSWVEERPDRWENEQRTAKEIFSDMSAEVAGDGCALIFGTIFVRRRHLGKIGPFFLKVIYPPDFPARDPNVHLLNRESWRDPGNHIEKDGRFCWAEVKDGTIDFHRDDSLKMLIENIGFRLMQVEMKLRNNGKFPGPERDHYDKGEMQAHAERKRNGIGPNTRPCICGRDVKYKHCHGKKELFKRGTV